MTKTHSRSTERPATTADGVVMLLVGLALLIAGPLSIAQAPDTALRVVLCADREAQPVINTGTLYG